MTLSYYDYRVCVRRTTTNLRSFFEIVLYDVDFIVVDEIVAKNRLRAYFSIYKLVIKHCKNLTRYHKYYLTMRLIGYYFYIVM